MKRLTPSECSDWLRRRCIIESPYERAEPLNAYYFQFAPPSEPGPLRAVTRGLFEVFGEFPGALVSFTDWDHYRPDEMALMDSLRRGHNERRPLIDAPGHLFGPTAEAEAIGHCYLAMTFGWSAYLYLASGAVTVYFWEGDFVDVWTAHEDLARTSLALVRSFKLRVTTKNMAGPDAPPDSRLRTLPGNRDVSAGPPASG